MSRIGKKTIVIPEGVTLTQNGNEVTVKGPKGELSRSFDPALTVEVADNEVNVVRPNDSKQMKTIHGTTRSLLNNMVEGVTQGFQKTLELNGV